MLIEGGGALGAVSSGFARNSRGRFGPGNDSAIDLKVVGGVSPDACGP